jgi:hypothetical protein
MEEPTSGNIVDKDERKKLRRKRIDKSNVSEVKF